MVELKCCLRAGSTFGPEPIQKTKKGSPVKASPIEERLRFFGNRKRLDDAGMRGVLRLAAMLVVMGLVSDVGRRMIQLWRGSRRLRRAGHFALKFVLGLGKFADGIADTAGETGQIFPTKEEEGDEQDDEDIRSGQIEKSSDSHRGIFGGSW